MADIYDVIIIGSGPAGDTAALYASRGNLKALVFEGWQPGGQLTTTTVIENYPGFEDGIDGNKLMMEMKNQAKRFGAEYKSENITGLDARDKIKKVYAGDTEYQARAVIIATGAKPRKLGLDSEEKYWSKGVSSCATCDGFFYKDKTVAVIGGGDSAMEESTFLTKFCKKVYLIHRREGFRASKVMLERAEKNDKIEFVLNSEVQEVLGDDQKVTGLKVINTEKDETSEMEVDGMFLAIGHIPSTKFLEESGMELDDEGYILRKQNSMTSLEGVFAGGDCVDHRYRQAVTAAGQGCEAAIDAERWLSEQD